MNQKPVADIFLAAAHRISVPSEFGRAFEDTDPGMIAVRETQS